MEAQAIVVGVLRVLLDEALVKVTLGIRDPLEVCLIASVLGDQGGVGSVEIVLTVLLSA